MGSNFKHHLKVKCSLHGKGFDVMMTEENGILMVTFSGKIFCHYPLMILTLKM